MLRANPRCLLQHNSYFLQFFASVVVLRALLALNCLLESRRPVRFVFRYLALALHRFNNAVALLDELRNSALKV